MYQQGCNINTRNDYWRNSDLSAVPANPLQHLLRVYAAFSNMLKPVLSDPAVFTADLTQNIAAYSGELLMLSSECSFIGYAYQQTYHLPLLPAQTVHLEAKAMGHNMLTLNSEWSNGVISEFFGR